MRDCTFDGCNKRKSARGLCSGHYRQLSKGQTLTPLEHRHPVGMPLEEKFWKFVDKNGPNGCWLWTGGLNEKGYGKFNVAMGKLAKAHRYAWELLRGPIPDGYVIDHDHPEFGCHNPTCCNPDHLQAVPRRINQQRRRGAQVDSQTGERGVFPPNHKGLWRGEVKYTDEHGVQRSITKTSKERSVVSAWVVEMRQRYHN